MPYANPELGGFKAPVGSIGTRHIVEGVAAAMAIYRSQKDGAEKPKRRRGTRKSRRD